MLQWSNITNESGYSVHQKFELSPALHTDGMRREPRCASHSFYPSENESPALLMRKWEEEEFSFWTALLAATLAFSLCPLVKSRHQCWRRSLARSPAFTSCYHVRAALNLTGCFFNCLHFSAERTSGPMLWKWPSASLRGRLLRKYVLRTALTVIIGRWGWAAYSGRVFAGGLTHDTDPQGLPFRKGPFAKLGEAPIDALQKRCAWASHEANKAYQLRHLFCK